jgi:two-component system KDP operon response regulator KdpE
MIEPGPVIVCIEDDPQIRRFLRTGLGSQGYQVFEADTGKQGCIEVGLRKTDLVILDLGLPDMDGAEVVRRLREWTNLPIIVLSARSRETDKITALDAGADDYLTKPFGLGELLARIRVALRHAATTSSIDADQTFSVAGLRVDLAKRQVSVNDEPVHLTPIEYRLLAVLIKHAGKVLTHRQLLKEVWGPAHIEHSHYLRVYMTQLRHKLEADPTQPRFLLTEAGVGYRLVDEQSG